MISLSGLLLVVSPTFYNPHSQFPFWAWGTISKPMLNVRQMQLKACLNTSGMGGLAFKQTESETHTSNNWHLFTPEMGCFKIFNWIRICRWFACQGNLERPKKSYYIWANISIKLLYSIVNLKHIILAYQGKANNKTQLLSFSEEKVLEKTWRKFSKLLVKRKTCVNEQTNTHQCTIIHWNSLVCGWIPTEFILGFTLVSLFFFCKEIYVL